MFHYVYQITHDATGRFYRGVRASRVRPELDPYLGSGTVIRRLVRKHGRDAFTKVVLSTHESRAAALVAEADAVPLELVEGDPLCINLRGGGEANDGRMSAETRQKMSRARKGKIPGNMEALHAASRGKPKSPEMRARISATLTGRTLPEETRQKMSDAHKGQKRTPEQRARIAEANRKAWKTKNATRSPESRRKQSESMKRAWARGDTDLPRKHSPETREKIRQAALRQAARARAAGG